MKRITGTDMQAMVSHWLNTPTNGYLGSGYGQDAKALLQRPLLDGAPEAYLAKLRVDVPVLQVLAAGDLNLYAAETPPDRVDLVIDVAGRGLIIPT